MSIPTALAFRMRLVVIALLLATCTAATAATSTTTTLSVSPSTSVSSGTVVTLTATVMAGATAVSPGQVLFCNAAAAKCEDSAIFGTAILTTSGTATLKTRFGVGTHSVKAVFRGTTSYTTSTSGTTVISVSGGTSTTSIAASGSAGNYTLSSVVTGQLPIPTGSVSYVDTTNANYPLGTGTLGSGVLGGGFNLYTVTLGTAGNICATGDLNGDGLADFVVAWGTKITPYLSNGDGTFTAKTAITVASTSACALADFNRDGKLDLVAINGSTVSSYLGNGDGTFTAKATLTPTYPPHSIVVGDFNQDGFPDFAIGTYDPVGDNTYVEVWKGNGDGTFTKFVTLTQGLYCGGLAAVDMHVVDLNQDGFDDLVMDGGQSWATFKNGALSAQSGGYDGTAAGCGYSYDTYGDFNGDGVPDWLWQHSGASTLQSNLGSYSAVSQNTTWPSSTWNSGNPSDSAGSPADFNGDGKLDFASVHWVNSSTAYLELYYGNGNDTFSLASQTSIPSSAGILGPPCGVADFNGDGIPDVAICYGTTTVVIALSKGSSASTSISGVSVPGGGTHYAQALYSGDANYAASSSGTIPLTGTPIVTTTTLNVSPSTTFAYGTNMQLTASISPYQLGSYNASGTVTFYDGGTSLGSSTVSSGQALLSNNTLSVGSHSVKAVYAGDTNFAGSTSTSTTVTVTKPTPTLTLVSNLNPSTFGSAVTFTVTLPSDATGTITFYDGATSIGTGTISSGTATLTISNLSVGSHSISATFPGDSKYASATSNTLSQVVNTVAVTLALTSTINPSTYLQSVTFTVTATGVLGVTPTGTVTLKDGATTLTTLTLDATGKGTYTTSTLSAGSHPLAGSYNGDGNYF